jgi:hypothetical protein
VSKAAALDLSGFEARVPCVICVHMDPSRRGKERPLPPTGGGPPIFAASGRIVNPTKPYAPTSLTLTLTVDAQAKAVGCAIVDRVRAAGNADDFDAVSTLLVLFPEIVPRVAEFHALMDELVRKGDDSTIRKILRTPGGRGRPHVDNFNLVALIEHVMTEQKLEHVTDALRWLDDAFSKAREQGETNLPWLPSTKTMQNTYSRLAEVFRLWSGTRYVPAELVTAQSWNPPGYRPEPLKLTVTRLSGAIVLHSPDDKVTEPPHEGEPECRRDPETQTAITARTR